MRLEDKVALISGGARGMGAVEAKLFSREGAKVVIGDVLEDEGRRTEAEINESGGECVFVRLDVTSEESWQSAVSTAVDRFGKLDILVNNAGIYRTHNVADTSEEEWDLVMDINAKGVFPWHQGRHPRHEGQRQRLHRQHLLGGRAGRQPDVLGLYRLQGSGTVAHQVHCHPVRTGRDPMQLGSSRHHPDGHDCPAAVRRCLQAGPHQPDANRGAWALPMTWPTACCSCRQTRHRS